MVYNHKITYCWIKSFFIQSLKNKNIQHVNDFIDTPFKNMVDCCRFILVSIYIVNGSFYKNNFTIISSTKNKININMVIFLFYEN